MDNTPNLKLPYIIASQAQKHVTHNDAIRALDALTHIAVLNRTLTAPPAAPNEGNRYVIAANPTGAWSGQAGKIAAFQDGGWLFYSPQAGWIIYDQSAASLMVFSGTAWTPISASGATSAPSTLGVNAVADTTNRLAVSSPSTLLTHEGTSHRLTINKAATANTASLVFQTAFSGRAEFGLTGNDDWSVKVSPNGTAWKDAIIVNKTTGAVSFPNSPNASAAAPTNGFDLRAKLNITPSTSLPPNANVLVNWGGAAYDTGGFYNPAFPSRVTIPNGIRAVVVNGYVQAINISATAFAYITLTHLNAQGSVVGNLYFYPIINGAFGCFNTPPLSVQLGDYFTINVLQSSGVTASLLTDTRNYIAITSYC